MGTWRSCTATPEPRPIWRSRPGGRRLATLSSEAGFWGGDGTIRVWDVDLRATLPMLRGHTRAVYPVAYSPDGRWIASGSWDGTVRLWDAATGEPCAKLSNPGFVQTLAYGPDGSWLAAGNVAENRLRIWDVATGRVRKEIQVPGGTLWFVSVRPDGKRLALTVVEAQSNKHRLQVCDLASGEPVFSAEGKSLGYSPDGRWLAALAADDKTVLLLDARTHVTAARLAGHEKTVNSAAFSPDSRCLVTCSADRTVRLWQIEPLTFPPPEGGRVLCGHTSDVFAAAFHPDGKRLATGGRDGVVWLWDRARGEEVARLRGHTSFVWSLAFSPDGAALASGSGDATVGLWDTAPLKTRYQARREAETLRPQAERLVQKLFQEKKNADDVAASIRLDRMLSKPQLHAAFRALLRRSASQGGE